MEFDFKEINYAINFINKLIDEIKSNTQKLIIFIDEFNQIYSVEYSKLPYHINLIDELRANENAHSRIFEKLLRYQDAATKKYEILENFLTFIIEKYRIKEDFRKIIIQKPFINQELRRIDLWIRDTDYTIIFENKIQWAKDQLSQLERYINTAKQNNYEDEQIYVLYLAPTYEKEPEKQSWGVYYDKDIYKKRYLNLSFKDDIIPWLKENLLSNIQTNNIYLTSAIEQYIDHLEGKFNLRTINNKMNMVLQDFIKEKLGIKDLEPELAFKALDNKIKEVENVLSQLDVLKDTYQDEIDEKYFSNCYAYLKDLGYNVVRRIDGYYDYHPKSVGVKLISNITSWIGGKVKEELFVQVNSNNNNKKLSKKTKQIFEDVLVDEKIEKDKDGYYIWAFINNENDALNYLIELCNKMVDL